MANIKENTFTVDEPLQQLDSNESSDGLNEAGANDSNANVSPSRRALMEVYNARGTLTDSFRRRSINSLLITETEPANIASLNFAALIPQDLRSDQHVSADLIKRLMEAARHRQRIARANYIHKNKTRQLQQIYKECSRREDQCTEIAKLIGEVKIERQWKGSMPSVEWFIRKKKGLPKSKRLTKEDEMITKKTKRMQSHLPITSSDSGTQLLSNVISQQNASAQEGELTAACTDSDSYCDYLKLMLLKSSPTSSQAFEQSDSGSNETPTVSSSGVSTTIINTGELHLPYAMDADHDMKPSTSMALSNTMKKSDVVEKLENYFNRCPPDAIQQYMFRLRQAANRRLAEQAFELISVLGSDECAQFLKVIENSEQMTGDVTGLS